MRERIREFLGRHRDEGISLLQRLVRSPSTQGNEREAQRIVIDELHAMKLEVDAWEPDGEAMSSDPYFYSTRSEFTGSPNAVGVLRGTGGSGGRSMILNGHIDVVPEGNRSDWRGDPYGGEVAEGRLYGRGASDMKGGTVSLLLAIRAIQAAGIRLKGDVIFQSVIEEESGGAGTLAAVARGYKADAALIPEPTNMRIFTKQQGSMWFRIRVPGRSAHGGTRYEGVSAIEKSMLVVEHIRELETARNARVNDPLYAGNPIPLPINIGVIEGGSWPSSVPDVVKLEGRIGVAPEETLDNAKAEMERWMEKLAEKDPWFSEHPSVLEWFGARWVPGGLDPGHELLQLLSSRYREVLGGAPVIEASPWGTDGGLLSRAGGTPCIVFGPGLTQVAHYPNEYIELDRMFEAAEIIALTLIDWCEMEASGG
ncbi:peptidase [Paenibacillus thermotolerans]|uniref:peptidase n=1 Tax=Paenibacillus thermotolerans TaxID=3027807 RepID=UPI002367AD84|nr:MULTISPECIES: peptidase [unclassified Paenibacillus]